MENSRSSKNSSFSSSSSSSSSIAYELFGPKESSSSGSSSSIFGSVFGPPPTAREINSSQQQYYSSETHQPRNRGNRTEATPGYNNYNNETWNSNQYYQQLETTIQPCHYSSSIYYGGQDVYEAPSSSSSEPNTMKRDGATDDSGPDGGQVNGASRGNWWQGSLYY